jgi:hypothetical protein
MNPSTDYSDTTTRPNGQAAGIEVGQAAAAPDQLDGTLDLTQIDTTHRYAAALAAAEAELDRQTAALLAAPPTEEVLDDDEPSFVEVEPQSQQTQATPEPTGGKNIRLEIPPDADREGALAARLHKTAGASGVPISLAQALESARTLLGIPAATPAQAAEPDDPAQEQAQEQQNIATDMDAEIARLEAELDEAATVDFDMAKMAEVNKKLAKAQADRIMAQFEAKQQAAAAQQTAAKTREAEWAQTEAAIQSQYPDAFVENSPFSNTMKQIHDTMKGLRDPLLRNPAEAAKQIAAMAANRLGVQPSSAPAPRQQAQPARVRPFGGSSGGTVPQQRQAAGQFDLSQVQTPEQFERLLAETLR